ncbi:DUF899 family protein [Streptomyces sp. NPDC001530]|uniref:DUF899 family protein n=1 Tax=Streptomyces sp. NPDC001530 TaxID=3364582 RepID=UPI0036B2F5DC
MARLYRSSLTSTRLSASLGRPSLEGPVRGRGGWELGIRSRPPTPTLRQHARNRGWHRLRLLSCGDSTFRYDLGSEDKDGEQDSTLSVFTRDGDGTVRHFYSAHPRMADDIDQRGVDLLAPVWHLLDLTPQGRGDWYPSLDY